MAKKRKISKALSEIIKEAKKLRREYPKRFNKWTDYVAQASAIYSKKHGGKSLVGHKHKKVTGMSKRKKRSAKRSKTVERIKKFHAAEGRAIRSLGSITGHVNKAKDMLLKHIADAEARKFAVTGKRAKSRKRKISKKIADLKRRYKKLC